jgi:proteic killer suppression protein
MIKSFKHKGLKKFYETGSTAGIQASHAAKLSLILNALESAESPEDIQIPSLRLHELKGERKHDWSMTVSGNWRVTFRFVSDGVELLNYEDYH